tara:strand:+ start:754 stop:1269 length:516 start_codon:yes stop_codon:yes gene_type:complete
MSEKFKTLLREIKTTYPKLQLYKQISKVLSYYSLYYDELDLVEELDLPIIVHIPYEINNWKVLTKKIQQTIIKQYCDSLDVFGSNSPEDEREWVLSEIQKTKNIQFHSLNDVYSYFRDTIEESKTLMFFASIKYPNYFIETTTTKKENNLNDNFISITDYRLAFFDFILSL